MLGTVLSVSDASDKMSQKKMGFVVIRGRGWGKWGLDEGSQKVQPSSYTQCQGCNVSLLFTCCHRLRLFVTPWTVARQAPLSVGFSRQEYWSGLPFPSPGIAISLIYVSIIDNPK